MSKQAHRHTKRLDPNLIFTKATPTGMALELDLAQPVISPRMTWWKPLISTRWLNTRKSSWRLELWSSKRRRREPTRELEMHSVETTSSLIWISLRTKRSILKILTIIILSSWKTATGRSFMSIEHRLSSISKRIETIGRSRTKIKELTLKINKTKSRSSFKKREIEPTTIKPCSTWNQRRERIRLKV